MFASAQFKPCEIRGRRCTTCGSHPKLLWCPECIAREITNKPINIDFGHVDALCAECVLKQYGAELVINVIKEKQEVVNKHEKEIAELKQRIRELESDVADMDSACQTTFYRAKCGHLHEQGITCPASICKDCTNCSYCGPDVDEHDLCGQCRIKFIARTLAARKQ